MPPILFDPSIKKVQYGGKLDKTTRATYLELCKQMTSREPNLNYKTIRDAILDILKDDVLSHIQTLPETDRKQLKTDTNIIFSHIDASDTNYLASLNIISFQISMMFTQYIFNITQQFEPFIDTDDTYITLTETNEWMNYSAMKAFLLKHESYHVLLAENTADIIYMAFIGFLKLDEILESYFNNVFYVGLSYTAEWVDGDYYYPLAYLSHDVFHSEMYSNECPSFPTIINGFKDFRKYVKAHKDTSTRYSIDFAIFFFIHEDPYCSNFVEDTLENKLQNKATLQTITNRLTMQYEELTDLHNLGMAIPVAYRTLENGSETKLDEKKVMEYINLVAKRYIECWKEYRSSLTTGGSRYRRRTSRSTHRKHTQRVLRKKYKSRVNRNTLKRSYTTK